MARTTSVTWYRYGHVPRAEADERDELLDRFMPDYEVVERHSIRVAAPAALTLAAAREQDLLRLPLVRAIFKAREMAMGAAPDDRARPQQLLAEMQSLGWGVLAEVPGREIVVGAVTKPWEPNVTFQSLPPEEFAAFCQPGFVRSRGRSAPIRSARTRRPLVPKPERWQRTGAAESCFGATGPSPHLASL